jgi:hypothetical protein
MSFVHCPSCHRAYDLRRQASCPACRQRDEAKNVAKAAAAAEPVIATAAVAAAPVVSEQGGCEQGDAAVAVSETVAAAVAASETVDAAVAVSETVDAELVDEPVAAKAAAAFAAADPRDLSDAALEPIGEPPRPQRIVAMVEELAALLERATSEELEAARAQLHQRGLRAPWTAQLTSGGRFLLAAGEKLVTSAIRAPQQGARKLARRLRDAWSGGASL